MQGMHAFEPKAKANIDLESFVAEDHFLRQIVRVLDLKLVLELTAGRYADGQGRPSIDPEVFFCMQLVAYFYGIATDRRCVKKCATILPTAGSADWLWKTRFRTTRH
jgi:transposase